MKKNKNVAPRKGKRFLIETIPCDPVVSKILLETGGKYRWAAVFCIIRGGVDLSRHNQWAHTLRDGVYHFYARQDIIANLLGISKSVTKSAIKWLVENKYLIKTYHNTRERGRMNNRLMYTLHESIRSELYPKYPPANSRLGKFMREKLQAKKDEPEDGGGDTTGPGTNICPEELSAMRKEVTYRRDPILTMIGPDRLIDWNCKNGLKMPDIKGLASRVNKSVTEVIKKTSLYECAKTNEKINRYVYRNVCNPYWRDTGAGVMAIMSHSIWSTVPWRSRIGEGLPGLLATRKLGRIDEKLRRFLTLELIDNYGGAIAARAKDRRMAVDWRTLDCFYRLSQCRTRGAIAQFILDETRLENGESRTISGFKTWAIKRFNLQQADIHPFFDRLRDYAHWILSGRSRWDDQPGTVRGIRGKVTVGNPFAYLFTVCRRSALFVRALRERVIRVTFFFRRPRTMWYRGHRLVNMHDLEKYYENVGL